MCTLMLSFKFYYWSQTSKDSNLAKSDIWSHLLIRSWKINIINTSKVAQTDTVQLPFLLCLCPYGNNTRTSPGQNAKKVIVSSCPLQHFSSGFIIKQFLQDPKGEDMNTRTWLGDVQYQDNPASICGLEISFSSVPQDIDIKLIPGNSNCAIDNQGELQIR